MRTKKNKIKKLNKIDDKRKVAQRRKHENPPCNKYTPNWEYVYKKTSWGVQWDKSTERDFSMIKRDKNIKDTHMPIYSNTFKIDCKTFVDFGKQTKRASFAKDKRINLVSANAVQSKTTRKYTPIRPNPNYNNNTTSFQNVMTKEDIQCVENTYKNLNRRNVSSKSKVRAKSADAKKKPYQRAHAPDFNKMIPRDQKRRGDKITVIPFNYPDYSIRFPSIFFKFRNTYAGKI